MTHIYNDLYQNCDKVLALFKTKQRWIDEDIYSSFPNEIQQNIITALQELVSEKYVSIEIHHVGTKTYTLLGKGSNVLDKGGFRNYFDELNRKEEIKKLIDQSVLRTNQSVVDTNKTVQINATTQARLTIYALIIAAIAATVPLITLVKDIVAPAQLIDTRTKSLIEKQQVSIDSLKQSLDTLNTSLKNLKTISYSKDTTKTK